MPIDYDPLKEDENKELIPYKKMYKKKSWIRKILRSLKKIFAHVIPRKKMKKKMDYKPEEDQSLDWWSKYFASMEVGRKRVGHASNSMYVNFHGSLLSKTWRFQEERSRELGSFSPGDQKLVTTFKVPTL